MSAKKKAGKAVGTQIAPKPPTKLKDDEILDLRGAETLTPKLLKDMQTLPNKDLKSLVNKLSAGKTHRQAIKEIKAKNKKAKTKVEKQQKTAETKVEEAAENVGSKIEPSEMTSKQKEYVRDLDKKITDTERTLSGKQFKKDGGLVGGQNKLDVNKDGKITGTDFEMLKKKHGGKITYRMTGGQVVGAGYD
tara:strand:+ start:198 stop:770 length:573 start_codon:yes stop_codon:yes gene_type:complete